jgi:glycosyltransferase involved in cell wall biosynthesis
MRVMLLVTDLERGGTPLRLARLARGLAEAGVEVHAGCLAPPGPVSADLEAAGVPTFACGARGPRDLQVLVRLRQIVNRIAPDLIHSTLTHANVAARLAGAVSRIPVVGSTATIEVERKEHLLLERISAGLDRAHIVNSHAVAEHVIRRFGVPRGRVYVVPPAPPAVSPHVDRAEARAALGIPEHEFVVAWVGRFDPAKRLELVIRCAEIMTRVATRFLLVGDGPERSRVEQMLRLSSARRVVHLLGWREDVAAVLAAADAFLFPSLTEGMPNAVLEAMAAGLPVVGSDIPALRELSRGGELLRLVAGEAPSSYAAALMELREDEPARRALGERAASWVRQELDPRATVAAVLRVYERVLGAK